MKNISLENITQAVVNHGDQGKTHPHLHEIYASLVRHLHAFVREVNLTGSYSSGVISSPGLVGPIRK